MEKKLNIICKSVRKVLIKKIRRTNKDGVLEYDTCGYCAIYSFVLKEVLKKLNIKNVRVVMGHSCLESCSHCWCEIVKTNTKFILDVTIDQFNKCGYIKTFLKDTLKDNYNDLMDLPEYYVSKNLKDKTPNNDVFSSFHYKLFKNINSVNYGDFEGWPEDQYPKRKEIKKIYKHAIVEIRREMFLNEKI